LTSVACQPLLYFSPLSHKRHDFRKKKLRNVKCLLVFTLQILSEKFLDIKIQLENTINLRKHNVQ
jgi:hypothetical protein